MARYGTFRPSLIYATTPSKLNETLRLYKVTITGFRPITTDDMFITAGRGGSIGRGGDMEYAHICNLVTRPRFIVAPVVGEPNAGAWWE